MFQKVFKGYKPRKFSYIPRHYDKENNDLIYNRIGDGKFAQSYVRKKKGINNDLLDEEKRIDFSSYRARQKQSSKSPQFNTFIIFVGLLLVVMVIWLITNPDFTDIFAK